MKNILIFLVIVMCLIANQVGAAMNEYCQSPPFISAAVSPNVLMVVDTSGSMGWKAYSYGGTAYDPTKVYEGYFDPEKNYALNSEGVYEETTGSCPNVCTSYRYCSSYNWAGYGCQDVAGDNCKGKSKWNCCAQPLVVDDDCGGNRFNYDFMSRVDLLRWAMTGGKPTGCNNNYQTCDPGVYGQPSANLPCDATGCIIETSGGIKIKARWDRITGIDGGLLYQLKNLSLQPRIGSMFFDTNQVNRSVRIGDFTASASFDAVNPYRESITALNNESPGGSTPIGPALWAAYAYLAQNTSTYGSPDPQSGAGNEWKNPMYQCVDADNNGNCQGNELTLVPCAKNFVILLTDGQWNRGGDPGSIQSTCSIDTGFENHSADPVVPAYWLHKKGFLNSITNISTNVESLYTLGLWLGGTGENSLKQVAMYGGFDTDNEWPSNLTDYPKTSGCEVDDCGTGKGSSCTALPPSSTDWDQDGNNIPDTFFKANDASEIKNQILTIILDILRKASSGTAVSVLSSSEGSGANLMQALFYPKRTFLNNTEVSWTSDLMNYWYYMDPYFKSMQIREDTNREGADEYTLLDLTKDYITNFSYDEDQNKTIAYRWHDSSGQDSTPTYIGSVAIEETKAIWRAGFNLWWTNPADRKLFTSIDGVNLTNFDTDNSAVLGEYLGQSSVSAAKATINFIRGEDCVDATGEACACGTASCSNIGRSRTITTGICSSRKIPCNNSADCPTGESCEQQTHVWKMGDIISSTPRIMGPSYLNMYNAPPPFGYSDKTYKDFIQSNDYKKRQSVFVGANDGMLHAFRLGQLIQNWSDKKWYEIAKQKGGTGAGGIGTESFSFIPKNALPYLQYLQDEDYCHIYLVDGPITLTDSSVSKPSTCTQSNYWDCPKITTMTTETGHDVDFSQTSWRSILIGSMGIGGATCDAAVPDDDRISTPLSVSGNPVGWSSYYALDVTDEENPKLMWEYSHADLGVTNVGPAIVKVGGTEKRCTNDDTKICSTDTDCGTGTPSPECVNTNGRWFAILASGSTGPISNLEFKGASDKTLKLFILDAKTGIWLRTIDTNIPNAFAGSISTNAIDLERPRPYDKGNYQDDAVYIGYVKDTNSGGVIRLVINDNIDPNTWTWSKIFKDGEIGPVTTSVVNLLDRIKGKLWIYFAEGRYFYKKDDIATQRKLFGVQEPCFNSTTYTIESSCAPLELAALKDQTTSPSTALTDTEKGWYIKMDPAASPKSAERVISNPTPDTNGAIFFLSFAPTDDICQFGGTTYLWGMDYKSGSRVNYIIQGKALVQVSTGEIKELNLADAFTEKDNRRTVGFPGIPPTGQGVMIVTNPSPTRKFMHVQEQ